MAKRKRNDVCVYCGKNGAVTRDHVPPKCLFKPPLPADMITVAACPECHDSFKLEDEYFRTWIAMRRDVFDGPSGDFLWQKTLRSLKAPEARAHRSMILSSLRQMEVHSEDGIYLGDAPGFQFPPSRPKATANRMLRGLFGYFMGHRVPDSHSVSILYDEFLKDRTVLRSPEVTEMLNVLASAPLQSRGGSVLKLKFVRTPGDPDSTAWIIRILDSVTFFGFTIPTGYDSTG